MEEFVTTGTKKLWLASWPEVQNFVLKVSLD